MSHNTKDVFDGILVNIAREVYPKSVVTKLGTELGFIPAEVFRFNEENKQEGGSYMGTLDMLRQWRQKQTMPEEREKLKVALKKADLSHLLKYLSADDVEQQPSHEPPGASSLPSRVTKKQIDKLSKLLPDGKYSELCGILGFEYSYITKIKKKHFMDSTAAFEELLHEWRDKAGSIEDLDAALKEADLGGLEYKN